MSSDLIRVILVDDHAVVRAGLKAVLGSARDIDVVGEGSNGTEAIALAGRLHPDVVVMDLAMQGMDGIAATKALASSEGGPRVLVLTMHPEKDEHADDRARYEKLTDRERDVLRLTAAGYTAPEIGEKLFISPKAVDTYKQRINENLGLQHRADYVKLALKLGLLEEEAGKGS
jgi:DNA-binding NarL/FixJ family response regulator